MTSLTEPLTFALRTPLLDAGAAIALIEVRGDIDAACERLNILPLAVGQSRLTSLCGVDTGVALRPDSTTLYVTPHGGPLIVRTLLAELARRGLRPAEATRFPEARNPIEAHMLAALATAPSPAAVDLLLRQPTLWNACPDSPNDSHRDAVLNRLLSPPLVIAIGPANIGKSSLINALARRNVSVVCDAPGTTRDHVGVMLELDGLVVRWIDTPGVRDDADPIEAAARQHVLPLLAQADLLLNCFDHTATPLDLAAQRTLPPGAAPVVLTVSLRADLAPCPSGAHVSVSLVKGDGLSVLARVIRETLVPRALVELPIPWRFWPS